MGYFHDMAAIGASYLLQFQSDSESSFFLGEEEQVRGLLEQSKDRQGVERFGPSLQTLLNKPSEKTVLCVLTKTCCLLSNRTLG